MDHCLSIVGGAARTGLDDLFAIGPPEVLFPALKKFCLEESCSLKLERSKTEVFTWSDKLPDNIPEGLTVAGSIVDQTFLPGFMCYGIPIGTK